MIAYNSYIDMVLKHCDRNKKRFMTISALIWMR